ncbi:hypothetical protein ACFW04_014184 [Cataglyphis niger]
MTCADLRETDILKIIEINLDAKAAYQILNDSNREKKDAARAKLSADIIKHELTKKFFFDAKRLKELAEQISQCIPGEIGFFLLIETYYVPYKKLLNKKSNAKGKLYDKYLNFLRSLRNNGLAPLSRNMIETQTASNIFENIKGQLKWLSIHKEPFEDVKLDITQSTHAIFDYINDFSVLQLSTGYILLLSDFNKLYSD